MPTSCYKKSHQFISFTFFYFYATFSSVINAAFTRRLYRLQSMGPQHTKNNKIAVAHTHIQYASKNVLTFGNAARRWTVAPL